MKNRITGLKGRDILGRDLDLGGGTRGRGLNPEPNDHTFTFTFRPHTELLAL